MINNSASKYLLILLLGNIVITAFHYTDNFLNFEHYPDPSWLTQDGIWMAWIILTVCGILGYVLYIKGLFAIAYLCLGLYSITGGLSPGHYFFPAHEAYICNMHQKSLGDRLILHWCLKKRRDEKLLLQSFNVHLYGQEIILKNF